MWGGKTPKALAYLNVALCCLLRVLNKERRRADSFRVGQSAHSVALCGCHVPILIDVVTADGLKSVGQKAGFRSSVDLMDTVDLVDQPLVPV